MVQIRNPKRAGARLTGPGSGCGCGWLDPDGRFQAADKRGGLFFRLRAGEITAGVAYDAIGGAAFTLIEMLLALAVSAIVLAGIGGVFYSALRLRESTNALLDESTSLQQALTLLRRDLQGALPPNVMAGDFRIGNVNSGIGQTVGLQFSTTTGVIKDDAPWGDLQDVTYELRNPTARTVTGGRELIRSVSRNLLTTMTLDYTEQPLLTNVESLEFQGYNGMDWQDLWDTSLTETNLPVAVRVRLQLVPPERADLRQRQPIEMIIPLTSQSRTNQVQTTSSGQ